MSKQDKIAAIVDYVCDQNCPSTPMLQLYRIPHDTEARNTLLRDLWKETFASGGEDLDDLGMGSWDELVVDEESPYGDLSVGNGNDFLIVQYMQTNESGDVEVR